MAWVERYFDKEKECMSRDEMTTLQSERLVKQVAHVYNNVAFYNKKMKELGIDYIQGFYFSRPVDSDEFIRFMKEKSDEE